MLRFELYEYTSGNQENGTAYITRRTNFFMREGNNSPTADCEKTETTDLFGNHGFAMSSQYTRRKRTG
jgi:hypothetical protein